MVEVKLPGNAGPARRTSTGRSMILGVVGLVLISASVYAIWALSTKYSTDMKEELEAAQNRTSFLEQHLKRYAEDYARRTKKNDIEFQKAVAERDHEIRLLRETNEELKTGVERLLARLSSRGGKEAETATPPRASEQPKTAGGEKAPLADPKKRDREIDKLYAKIAKLQKKLMDDRNLKGIVIPPLIDALSHSDMKIRNVIGSTLKALTGRYYGSDQTRWRSWWKEHRLDYLGKP